MIGWIKVERRANTFSKRRLWSQWYLPSRVPAVEIYAVTTASHLALKHEPMAADVTVPLSLDLAASSYLPIRILMGLL